MEVLHCHHTILNTGSVFIVSFHHFVIISYFELAGDEVGARSSHSAAAAAATAPSLQEPVSRLLGFSQGWVACLPWQQAPIISRSRSVLFLSQSGGVTGLPGVFCPARDHPPARPTHFPTPHHPLVRRL